jgi:hypothetical protein
VDVWCPAIGVDSYCDFLHTLFDRVTTRVRVSAQPESAWVYNFRALEDVQVAQPGHLTDTDSDCNAEDGKVGTNGDEAQDENSSVSLTCDARVVDSSSNEEVDHGNSEAAGGSIGGNIVNATLEVEAAAVLLVEADTPAITCSTEAEDSGDELVALYANFVAPASAHIAELLDPVPAPIEQPTPSGSSQPAPKPKPHGIKFGRPGKQETYARQTQRQRTRPVGDPVINNRKQQLEHLR